MQKGTESFSEIEDDDDAEDGFLDALAQERTTIQEIEQEKEENSFIEKTATVPTSKKKLWRDTQKEALARLEDSVRTEEDFCNVQSWWDRLEANADRRYRYHVIGVPIFLWNGVRHQRKSFSPNRSSLCSGNR